MLSTLKTTFALSAPASIAIFDFDDGLEYVKDRYVDSKKIIRVGDSGDGINQLAFIPSEDVIERQKQAEEIWSKFKASYYAILDNPDIQTVVIDTATHLWEIAMWSEIGRVSIERADKEIDVLPFHYGDVNTQFRSLFSQAKRSKKHVIFNHKEKEEWGSKGGTGRMIFHGWKHTSFEIEIGIRASMFGTGEKAVPNFRITKDRITKLKEGHEYSGYSQCNFAYIASDITETPIEDWQ